MFFVKYQKVTIYFVTLTHVGWVVVKWLLNVYSFFIAVNGGHLALLQKKLSNHFSKLYKPLLQHNQIHPTFII